MVTIETLKQLDDQGISQPTGFDRHASLHGVSELAPSLEAALGERLELIDDIEDSSAFAEVAARTEAGTGELSLAKFGFTFSTFGGLVLVWSNVLTEADLEKCFSLCEPILRKAGFHPVRAQEVEREYTGRHRVWQGQSWRDRLFGEP